MNNITWKEKQTTKGVSEERTKERKKERKQERKKERKKARKKERKKGQNRTERMKERKNGTKYKEERVDPRWSSGLSRQITKIVDEEGRGFESQ